MLSLFTSGVVPGSESMSSPSCVVITVPSTSTSSDIHATFVNISSCIVSTIHSISIVSDDNVCPSNAFKFVFSVFVSSNLFVSSSY